MTITTTQLSESLQNLIDARLDTIDRMLLGRVPRADRTAIVREVEGQIYDLLQERDLESLDRDDVLAVLARLDPPEAYLPEESNTSPTPTRIPTPRRPTPASLPGSSRLGTVSGIHRSAREIASLLEAPCVGGSVGLQRQHHVLASDLAREPRRLLLHLGGVVLQKRDQIQVGAKRGAHQDGFSPHLIAVGC